MKETGPTGRAEEIVESKIESWIPISYAVRHKGRHSSLPLSLPPPFWFLLRRRPREFIMFLARHSPPNALSALCPLRLPELCNFGTTPMVRLAEVALGDGVDDDKVGGLYSVLAAEVATRATGRDWREEDRRLTRLVPHFAPTSRVGDGCGGQA